MKNIRIGIIGVGNCASALIQGIAYYKEKTADAAIGLMHWEIGGYKPGDIKICLAYDVDKRKVGMDVCKAIFSQPNCTTAFYPHLQDSGVVVKMGRVLDGIAKHMLVYDENASFRISSQLEPNQKSVIKEIRDSGIEMLLNYLPVGSEKATAFYAECALKAGVAFINNIPVFIASDKNWADRFSSAGLPIMGDDIKSQLGATITHRTLVELFRKRGVRIDRSYQLNTGGNTDFLNMLDRQRLISKKVSKTEAVQFVGNIIDPNKNLHIGPSDYVPWQEDNKLCFLRIEGRIFGDIPINIEARLSVEDSPNSAGVVIDAIRCCKLALNHGIEGVLEAPSSYFFKHPIKQIPDSEAFKLVEKFIAKNG